MTRITMELEPAKTRSSPYVFDPKPLLRQVEMTLPDLRPRPMWGRFGKNSTFDCSHHVLDQQIAEALDCTLRQVQRWKHGTRLRREDADRLAVRCGFHPANIWVDWYELVGA